LEGRCIAWRTLLQRLATVFFFSLLCLEHSPLLGPLPPPRPFLFMHPRLKHTNSRSHSRYGFARALCPVSVLLLCWQRCVSAGLDVLPNCPGGAPAATGARAAQAPLAPVFRCTGTHPAHHLSQRVRSPPPPPPHHDLGSGTHHPPPTTHHHHPRPTTHHPPHIHTRHPRPTACDGRLIPYSRFHLVGPLAPPVCLCLRVYMSHRYFAIYYPLMSLKWHRYETCQINTTLNAISLGSVQQYVIGCTCCRCYCCRCCCRHTWKTRFSVRWADC
jgi:hypothetical protein